jgi:hypothetical protein
VSSDNQRLAVAALLPLITIVILWRIGRSTYLPATAGAQPPPPVRSSERSCPLSDANFWAGDKSIVRLRRLHLAFASFMVTILLAWS